MDWKNTCGIWKQYHPDSMLLLGHFQFNRPVRMRSVRTGKLHRLADRGAKGGDKGMFYFL